MVDTQANSEGASSIKPGGQKSTYESAYTEAVAKLSERTVEAIAEKSGSRIGEKDGITFITVPFLDDEIDIFFPDISFRYQRRDDTVPLWLQVLVLHYLLAATGVTETGVQITFKQLKGGMAYYPVFQKRAITPLINTFGEHLEDFITFGVMIGGTRAEHGDYALTFRAFPYVAVTFVIWEGDEDFPPAGNVIFDSSVEQYLTSDDVAMLCTMLAVMIIKKKFERE